MRKVSGIKFADPRLLRAFEREASRRLSADDAHRLLRSYTVHVLPDGLILEFPDMTGVAAFLERAREMDIAGRTIRVIKLISVTTTGSYRMPSNEVDRWARQRIDRLAHEGRYRDSLIFNADNYEALEEEFSTKAVEIGRYVR